MQQPASIRGVLALWAVGALIAFPSAAALGIGVDASGLGELKSAGGAPAYGQTWVGLWSKSGWSSFETDLRTIASHGATPVVLWYYWGDSISVSCVQYGCDGRTKGEWDAMAATMAQKANAVLGSKSFLVVLEPEFNKQGISSWETFDGYLASQAATIKKHAPNAKIVVGFGSWGGYDLFDRAVDSASYTGFQYMRASTRHSSEDAKAPVASLLDTAKDLKSRFGKPVIVFDFAIGSYGGWEWVQQSAVQEIKARRGELDAAGVVGIVWRYVRDNDYSSGYFGPAESTWGAKYRSGAPKSVWDDLVSLAKGTSGGTSTTSTLTGGAGKITSVKGNAWWIEATVSGSPSSVAARVNGGSWIPMPRTSWGSYAVSTSAPTGSTVEIKATFGGTTVTGKYLWPSGTPVTTSASTGGFTAVFSHVTGNDWWIQADVSANQPLASVSARVNGGSWHALALKSWGAWAASVHAPAGSTVELKATSTSGATSFSSKYAWTG